MTYVILACWYVKIAKVTLSAIKIIKNEKQTIDGCYTAHCVT